MHPERPAPAEVSDKDGGEILREENGTGEDADENQLGVTQEDVKDLANDAEGG